MAIMMHLIFNFYLFSSITTVYQIEVYQIITILHFSLLQNGIKQQVDLSPNWTITSTQAQINARIIETFFKQLPNLIKAKLDDCFIDAEICENLSRRKWPELMSLELCRWHRKTVDNKIGDKSCRYIVEAQWSQLIVIKLGKNSIGDQGCKILMKSKWPSLKQMHLSQNNIGDDGCSYIIQAKWPYQKRSIYVFHHLLREKQHYRERLRVSQEVQLAIYKDVKYRYSIPQDLEDNLIGNKGVQCLSMADWPSLQTLSLARTNIHDEGCWHLSRGQWPRLKQLWLNGNKFKIDGIRYLGKGYWPSINCIYFGQDQDSNFPIAKKLMYSQRRRLLIAKI